MSVAQRAVALVTTSYSVYNNFRSFDDDEDSSNFFSKSETPCSSGEVYYNILFSVGRSGGGGYVNIMVLLNESLYVNPPTHVH